MDLTTAQWMPSVSISQKDSCADARYRIYPFSPTVTLSLPLRMISLMSLLIRPTSVELNAVLLSMSVLRRRPILVTRTPFALVREEEEWGHGWSWSLQILVIRTSVSARKDSSIGMNWSIQEETARSVCFLIWFLVLISNSSFAVNSLCDTGKNTCSKNARCIER